MAEYKGLRADKKAHSGVRGTRSYDGLFLERKARSGNRTARSFDGFKGFVVRRIVSG